jgi:hypothetical protein
MTNTNCLEGIRCPKCGQKDRFFIHASITAEVTDDGAEVAPSPRGDIEWDRNSATECAECGYSACLKHFRKLPPDPEGMNDKRAAWAGASLRTFIDETGVDEEDALGDLLCDLKHWSDRHDYDFDAALDRARFHYEAETGGEPPF